MTEKKADRTAKIVATLRTWQEDENATVAQTTAIIGKSKNPLVKLLMEIIRNDSIMHHRVQQFMIDSLTGTPVTLTPEELGEVWELVEQHIAMERKTIGYGEELTKLCNLFVQKHLLTYLLTDEEKHDKLLSQLEDFKRKLHPYV
jgi:bacterioferritin (cytochrome b1)